MEWCDEALGITIAARLAVARPTGALLD